MKTLDTENAVYVFQTEVQLSIIVAHIPSSGQYLLIRIGFIWWTSTFSFYFKVDMELASRASGMFSLDNIQWKTSNINSHVPILNCCYKYSLLELGLNIVVKWLAFLLHIWKFPGQIFSCKLTILTDGFVVLLSFLVQMLGYYLKLEREHSPVWPIQFILKKNVILWHMHSKKAHQIN
jgi:hypothetical protein